MITELLKAACGQSQPAQPGAAERRQNFAILPEQTGDELAQSEVHTMLDKALRFLQGGVGYTLLDDALPSSRGGGGVHLRPPRQDGRHAAGPRGHNSVKLPEQDPQVTDAEVMEIIGFNPDLTKYAHYPEDLVLCWRFIHILGVMSPSAAAGGRFKHQALYKAVLQGVRLMHLCNYDYSDVVVVLACASVYFQTTFSAIGDKMGDSEAANVCVLLIYLAHSFVLDETCPLRCWHKHIFRKYCTLKVLDAALFRLFQMQGYKLRITEEEEKNALKSLLSSSNGIVARPCNPLIGSPMASTVADSTPASTVSSSSGVAAESCLASEAPGRPVYEGENAVLAAAREQKNHRRR